MLSCFHQTILSYRLTVTGVLLLCLGCAESVPPSVPKPASAPIKVRTVAVVQQEVQRTTTQPATVQAYFQAEIRAKVSGYVESLHVDIGDFVKAGDVLVQIAVPEMGKQREIIESRLRRLHAEERQAEAGVSLAKANVTSARALLEEAKTRLQSADAALAASDAEFQRVQQLVELRSLESRLLDEARKKRDSDRANKEAVRSSITSAGAEVSVAQAKQNAAEADLAAAQAETAVTQKQLEELDVLMAYATLRAPFDGVVTTRTMSPGDLVRKNGDVDGSRPLLVISRIDKLRIQVPVPERDAAFVGKGDELTLTLPSFPGETITAKVSRISHSLDPSTRTMLIEAEYLNENGKLLPGMFGQASIALANKVAANMLPVRAVRFDEEGKASVCLVNADSTVSVVPVETGIDDGNQIEIVSDLKPGQQVVDAHLRRFTDGQKVAVLAD